MLSVAKETEHWGWGFKLYSEGAETTLSPRSPQPENESCHWSGAGYETQFRVGLWIVCIVHIFPSGEITAKFHLMSTKTCSLLLPNVPLLLYLQNLLHTAVVRDPGPWTSKILQDTTIHPGQSHMIWWQYLDWKYKPIPSSSCSSWGYLNMSDGNLKRLNT